MTKSYTNNSLVMQQETQMDERNGIHISSAHNTPGFEHAVSKAPILGRRYWFLLSCREHKIGNSSEDAGGWVL